MEMAQGTTARCKRIFDFQQLYETFGAAKEHRALNTTKLSAGEEPDVCFLWRVRLPQVCILTERSQNFCDDMIKMNL